MPTAASATAPAAGTAPTEDADSTGGSFHVLMRIVRMAFDYPWLLALGLVFIVGASIFQLFIPLLIGDGVDTVEEVFTSPDADTDALRRTLVTTALFLLASAVLRGLFTFGHMYISENVAQRLGYRLRMLYYEKLQRLSFAYHDRVHTGDLLTRGLLDIEGIRAFASRGLLRVVYLAIFVSTGTFLMMRVDWELALISLSFVPIAAWRSIVARLQTSRGWRLYQEEMGRLTKVMDENLKGIRVVRSFSAEPYEMEKYDKSSNEAFNRAFHLVGVRAKNLSIITFAFLGVMSVVLLVGGLKVLDENDPFSLGQLAQFLAFMSIMQNPVRQLGMVVAGWAQGATSGKRLFEVLDQIPEIDDKPGAKDLVLSDGALRFENVDFAYMDEYGDEQVLTDVSFEARPGHTIGIVGPPGSGKSTLAHLIPRFYDPIAGRILIDEQDISDVTLSSLRRTVGVVEQDTFLFTTTVDNNVAYGDPWAEHRNIESATSHAQMSEYVERLPSGYGTLVGERGVSLSGGQRQRLSIARSIMLHPQVIVFDDSTAAIDAATEQRIRAALQEVTSDRATIIISHRLSSLMHANEILFLEGGKIVERGTHAELLELGGKYRDLYELQIRPEDDVQGGDGI
ncbi:MAG: ABC transporter ATP-binding protein [Chloroflexi bacterium]|nr:ABC transporter ATP-binding protein [Chloroflexota bacterium]MYK61874.1 ABC transporter ATP-binding protein [Chloroflexota bacterium]